MLLPQERDVYLDANFVIAYLVPNHSDHVAAGKVFTDLLTNRNQLNLTALTVDEVLLGSIKTLKHGGHKKHERHSEFYNDLYEIIDSLIKSPQVFFRQFENSSVEAGCLDVLEIIKIYNLRPRDAFHLCYMRDLEIEYIVTNDTDFDQISYIKRIDF